MAKTMTLTAKDCLYIEDIINASMLIYKKTCLEKELLKDEELKTHLDNICTDLQTQAETLLQLLKEAK